MAKEVTDIGTVENVIDDIGEVVDSAGAKGSAASKTINETIGEVADSAEAKFTGAKGSAASKTFNEAIKQVESFTENLGKALGSALQDRANVVMVRVNNDSLAYLDMLVEADVTKSRSESAAFLINEGIKANQALFSRIREITDQIASLKSQLREAVKGEE
ncbi:MAG TPA: hypothetical protein VEC93_21095 [Anaerolineae bacterium]|nr:hypothetical protein [Anaerolineae bacterium]